MLQLIYDEFRTVKFSEGYYKQTSEYSMNNGDKSYKSKKGSIKNQVIEQYIIPNDKLGIL